MGFGPALPKGARRKGDLTIHLVEAFGQANDIVDWQFWRSALMPRRLSATKNVEFFVPRRLQSHADASSFKDDYTSVALACLNVNHVILRIV